jgi:hypothetical protein
MRSFAGLGLWRRQYALRGYDALHLAAAELSKTTSLCSYPETPSSVRQPTIWEYRSPDHDRLAALFINLTI